ncbi:MAG: sodium:alanine symporter [Sulfuricurvum sp. PC08-66]|nr:MAG: sodium:alanine symporter [Sulfuricurvum sp. PC08-66]
MAHPSFSRIGFIMAAAGSAVGLGNVWKFPYITGQYGGGAFVLVYLLTIFLIGFSVLVAEMYIGSRGKSDTVTSFEHLDPTPRKPWKYAGLMAFNGLLVMTFYSVVIGWIFHYIFLTLTQPLPTDIPTAQANFTHLTTLEPFSQLFWHAIATLIVVVVLYRGVKAGIERMNMIMMPSLIAIFVGLLLYSMQFGEAFVRALEFMFYPDFSKLSSEAIVKAIGHAFFTLSIGMGAIMTYSAALPHKNNITHAAFWVAFLDTAIALIAGVLVFAFLFHFDQEPAVGPGLVFASMPVIFSQLGYIGTLLALLFFLALSFAGLTSAVSLTEPSVEYLINRFGFSRLKAVAWSGLTYFGVGVLVLLSLVEGTDAWLKIGERSLFGFFEHITDAILLPFSGLLTALFIGYILPKNALREHLEKEMGTKLYGVWRFSIRYIVPVALLFMLLNLTGIIVV